MEQGDGKSLDLGASFPFCHTKTKLCSFLPNFHTFGKAGLFACGGKTSRVLLSHFVPLFIPLPRMCLGNKFNFFFFPEIFYLVFLPKCNQT